MAKEKKLPLLTQVAKIASIFLLLVLAPFVPSSLKAPYLYFLFNALVLALGVEAGLLAAVPGTRDDKKPAVATTAATSSPNVKPSDVVVSKTHFTQTLYKPGDAVRVDVVAGAAAKKMTKKMVKRCPSRTSIFFIGGMDGGKGGDGDETVHQEEVLEVEVWKDGGRELAMTKQELFVKAEAFIGDFYKQLKMQREESWKKLQDLQYHCHYKAF